MKKDSGWWDEFFPAIRPLFSRIPQKQSNAESRFIIKKLGLRPGRRFLDCPCGIGRISIPLAKAGVRVTGVDITKSYLDELAARAKRMKLKIEIEHGDMRRINYDRKFHAAGNLWTSFGYFKKESDNLLVLKKMFKALRPGGRFMLHLINRDWIIANFNPSDWCTAGDIKILESRVFDYKTSVSDGTWTLIKNGEEKTFDVAIRVYSCHELLAMFESVGFVDLEACSTINEDPVSRDKRMMYIIGTRTKG